MIRIDRVAVAPLVAVLGILTCVAGRPTQATPLSDRTLVSIVGTNGNSTGSGTFNCSDAAAQFASNPNGNPPVNYIGYS